MGFPYPANGPVDGDEPTYSPSTAERALLAASPSTQGTRRLYVSDVDGGLLIHIQNTTSPLPTGAATEATLLAIKNDIDKEFGTWGYYSGINGTAVVSGKVVGISAYSALGGTMTINGGATINLPIGISVNIEPKGNLVSPTIIFTGTSTYLIEVVS